jgi:hypothetical protein
MTGRPATWMAYTSTSSAGRLSSGIRTLGAAQRTASMRRNSENRSRRTSCRPWQYMHQSPSTFHSGQCDVTGDRTCDFRRDRPKVHLQMKRESFFSLFYADREMSLLGAATGLLQFSTTTLCQIWHTMGCGRYAGTTAQANLACRLARSADGFSAYGSQEARFRAVPIANRSEA